MWEELEREGGGGRRETHAVEIPAGSIECCCYLFASPEYSLRAGRVSAVSLQLLHTPPVLAGRLRPMEACSSVGGWQRASCRSVT